MHQKSDAYKILKVKRFLVKYITEKVPTMRGIKIEPKPIIKSRSVAYK